MVVLGESHSRAHAGVGNAADQLPHALEDEQSKQAENIRDIVFKACNMLSCHPTLDALNQG